MSAPQAPVLVVGALPVETRALGRRLAGRHRHRGLVAGRRGDVSVLVGTTGDGAGAATRGLAALLARAGPLRGIVGIGLAGGLDPALRRGALVVADALGGTPAQAPVDRAWAGRVAARLSAARGPLASAPRLVATPEAKAALRAATGGALAVDLESAAWGAVASARGLPLVVLRIVFDRAGDTVPAFLARAAARDGRVRPCRLLAGALLRPSRLVALGRLARGARALAEALADAALVAAEEAPR